MKKHGLLLFILGAIFLKQLAWMVFIPIFQTPDEQAHFAQLQNIAETNSLFQPKLNTSQEIWISETLLGTNRDDRGDNKYTYHPEFNIPYSSSTAGLSEGQIASFPRDYRTDYVANESTWYPPSYYLLGAGVYKFFVTGTIFDRVFAVRLVSVLSLVALTVVTYSVGRMLFAGEAMALSLAVLVGFQPMLSFVHAGVTSDALFNLLFGLFLIIGLRLLNRGLNAIDLGLAGLVIALSFWTKPQANIMAFILIPLLLYLGLQGWTKNLKNYLLLLLVSSLSLFGIYSRLSNGVSILPETQGGNSILISIPKIFEHLNFTLNHTYREVLPWYWGVFRWLSLGLPNWLRQLTNVLTLGSLGGLVIYWFRSVLSRQFDKKFAGIIFLTFSLFVYFLALTTFDFGFRQSHGFSFGIQGRYFFPVIASQMAIFLVGLTAFIPKKFELLTAKTLAIGMIFMNIIVFFWVVGSYYSLSWPEFFIQASQYKPVWLKMPVNIIILASYIFASFAIIWALVIHGKKTGR